MRCRSRFAPAPALRPENITAFVFYRRTLRFCRFRTAARRFVLATFDITRIAAVHCGALRTSSRQARIGRAKNAAARKAAASTTSSGENSHPRMFDLMTAAPFKHVHHAAPFDIRRSKRRRNSRNYYLKSGLQVFDDACDKLPLLLCRRRVGIFHV
jgi:hypothetical protein